MSQWHWASRLALVDHEELLTVCYLHPTSICLPRTPPCHSSLFRIVSLPILPHDSLLSVWRLVLWWLEDLTTARAVVEEIHLGVAVCMPDKSRRRAEPPRLGRRPMSECWQDTKTWPMSVEKEMGMRNRFEEYDRDRIDQLVLVAPQGEWKWYPRGAWMLGGAAGVQNTLFSPVLPRNYTRSEPAISLGTKHQGMNGKESSFFHHHCYNRVEQQAIICIHWYAGVFVSKMAWGTVRLSIHLASGTQPFGHSLLGHFPRDCLSLRCLCCIGAGRLNTMRYRNSFLVISQVPGDTIASETVSNDLLTPVGGSANTEQRKQMALWGVLIASP